MIGIHDLVHGENVRAYITLTEGTERPTSQELIQFARARVGYKAPEEIRPRRAAANRHREVDRAASSAWPESSVDEAGGA